MMILGVRCILTVFCLTLAFSTKTCAQEKNRFKREELASIERGKDFKQTILGAIERSKRGDAYHLMGTRRILGGINELIKAKNDPDLIDSQIKLIDAITESATPSSHLNSDKAFKDEYMGWLSLTKSKEAYNEEVSLSESYSFLYIAEFLYILKQIGWTAESSDNETWWNKQVKFLEKNVWEKWIARSEKKYGKKYTFFLRSRTHMGSHWAGIARFLEQISSNAEIRSTAKEVYTSYDTLLKRNLKDVGGRYVWNSTYDDVTGTDAVSAEVVKVQDVSHGNHVVTYIINAYEQGDPSWTLDDINHLCATFKSAVYSPQARSFNTYVDGGKLQTDRTGFFIGDGWAKLARYDHEIYALCEEYALDVTMMKNSHQEFQFNSNLLGAKYSK